MSRYILAVDQSTQDTKGLLFDENGLLTARADRPHRQIVNDKGWVEHDPVEIIGNTVAVCGNVLAKAGTVDSWLVYCLTGNHRTDYSNASRTQLFNIVDLKWDAELCELFSVPVNSLPEVCMSDTNFGETDLRALLPSPVPIHGVLGDSHGALFGLDCRKPGQIKATYGTGSSIMMHIGEKPKFSGSGLVTSLAWGIDGRVEYVFEGNLNYTGAVMTWLREDVGLIRTDAEATELAYKANPNDRACFVPAFTGLGAAYAAGMAARLYGREAVYGHVQRRCYAQRMSAADRAERLGAWKQAVQQALCRP